MFKNLLNYGHIENPFPVKAHETNTFIIYWMACPVICSLQPSVYFLKLLYFIKYLLKIATLDVLMTYYQLRFYFLVPLSLNFLSNNIIKKIIIYIFLNNKGLDCLKYCFLCIANDAKIQWFSFIWNVLYFSKSLWVSLVFSFLLFRTLFNLFIIWKVRSCFSP